MDLILFDVLCRPGTQVRLRARLERADLFRRPVPGRTVVFRQAPLPGEPPLAQPLPEIGRAVTDRWGNAELRLRPATPGHSFFLAECPPQHGEARVTGTGLVACRSTDRPAAVLDIDGTLTSEATTLRTGAAGAVLKDCHALGAVRQLAERYDLVYLTGRRRQLVNTTRDWLIRQGLPIGPLFAQMSHVPVPGFLSGWWKGRLLSSLRARHPNLIVGIGNTAADAGAYSRNGMVPLIFADGRAVNAIPVGSWDQVDAMLLGDRLALPGPVRVLLGGGRAVLELTPDVDGRTGSVELRSALAGPSNGDAPDNSDAPSRDSANGDAPSRGSANSDAPSRDSANSDPAKVVPIVATTTSDSRARVPALSSHGSWPSRRQALLDRLRGTEHIRSRLVGEGRSPEPPPDPVSLLTSWLRWLGLSSEIGSDRALGDGARPSGTGPS